MSLSPNQPDGQTNATLDTFPKLLLNHARVRGNKVAMREKDLGILQSWTWSEVSDEVRALACGLAALGFKRGDKLAIIGDNRPRLYWGFAAVQCLGGIPVPLYQDSVADEMAYVLGDAEVRFALVEDQ
ncbi:AMP-binding protein [Sedimenticola selenatireducens]|uniref:AMP-binding protein n=1 Tax=Sedimenticola selenatireducens TaxID=191960 RepID=UPI00267FEC94